MSRLHSRTAILALGLAFTGPAIALPAECPSPAQAERFEAFRARIEGAESPEAARRLATKQTRLAHRAIERAAKILPGDPGIAEAHGKLQAFEAGVNGSKTQGEVAGQFGTLMATQAGSCDYTGVEIVVIVIGFILGILPGILFLFLFC